MPTKPLETLLYRELSEAEAKDVIEIASPLLQELVNYSTNAFARCQSSALGGTDADLATLILYLHVIEITDAVEILISHSCPAPTQMLLRSSFEAVLSIEFILEKESEYPRRSLAWLVAYVHNRLEGYELCSPAAPPGKSLRQALKDHKDEAMQTIQVRDPTDAIKNLQDFLIKPHIQPIEREFQKHPGWKWFQLFDRRLSNLRALARHLGREAEYLVLYKQWSSISHAHDLSRFMGKAADGTSGFRSLRDPSNIKMVTSHSANFILNATRMMLGKFRPGEDHFPKWFDREVRDLYRLITE